MNIFAMILDLSRINGLAKYGPVELKGLFKRRTLYITDGRVLILVGSGGVTLNYGQIEKGIMTKTDPIGIEKIVPTEEEIEKMEKFGPADVKILKLVKEGSGKSVSVLKMKSGQMVFIDTKYFKFIRTYCPSVVFFAESPEKPLIFMSGSGSENPDIPAGLVMPMKDPGGIQVNPSKKLKKKGKSDRIKKINPKGSSVQDLIKHYKAEKKPFAFYRSLVFKKPLDPSKKNEKEIIGDLNLIGVKVERSGRFFKLKKK